MFPNALEGIKKLILSQLLSLLSGGMAIISAVFAMTAAVAALGGFTNSVLGAGSGAIAMAVITTLLGIAALVFNIIGLVKARHDDYAFSYALTLTFISLGCNVLSNAMRAAGPLSSIVGTAGNVCALICTCYIIKGIMNLAEQLGNEGLISKGRKIIKIILIAEGAGFLTGLVASFLRRSPALSLLGSTLSLGAIIVEVAAYFLFLSYLVQGKNMLES